MIKSDKTKFRTDEKVLVECDFRVSTKCKGTYLKVYKNVIKGRINNNGKDRCQYCFNSITKTGINNFNHKIDKNEKFFESINSELKAYLLGWIAGDGSIKKDGLYLEINEKDAEILDLFRLNIAPDSVVFKRHDEKGENTICWKIHSVKIVNDLLRKLKLDSVGKKSDKISLPDLNDELLWAFIRGLFDSDGSIISPLAKGTSPSANICSTSKQMIKDLLRLCDSESIKYTITTGYPVIFFTGQNCLSFLEKIYKEASFFLQRKKKLYEIWRTWNPGCGTSVRSRKKRQYYPPISEEHKEKIRESNRKRKGMKYVRT